MFGIFTALLSCVSFLLYPKNILEWTYVLAKTLLRDIRMLIRVYKLRRTLAQCEKQQITIFKAFAENARRLPNKVAFYFEDEAWTYEKVEKLSNKIANYFEQQSYKKGQVIALLHHNCVEYLAIWLGLAKIGVVTALINTNLVKDSLLHSLKVSNCRAIIVGTEHIKSVNEILDKLESKQVYQFRKDLSEEHNPLVASTDLNEGLKYCPDIHVQMNGVSIHDPLLYIYTSGTTGFPKAALVTHLKFILVFYYFKIHCKTKENDVFYSPLPLYHGIGGLIAAGQAILGGSSLVIRKKFSASAYFKDCAKHNVTIGMYIGELCRYILAVPEDRDVKHQVKTLVGNGLKRQIWKPFVKRFEIEHVRELYGATEGNVYFVNTDDTEGVVGFIPRYLRWLFGATTIKCNGLTGEPIRNPEGFCMECDVDEPGILVGKITTGTSAPNYDGYTDKQSSEKNLLRNVFSKGDLYFNSRDLLVYDQLGYYSFKDRTGDTFRWKGENVSTAEVEGVVSNLVYLNDVSVYGVKVPHAEGNAGMAAILDANQNLDIKTLGNSIKQSLPTYAIPIFLRIMDSIPKTGTFKFMKTKLKEEAFDVGKIEDKLYFYHPKVGNYVELTEEIYGEIEKGDLKI